MIYLDNSATTALSEAAKGAMQSALERFGNPSSLHTGGYEAHMSLESDRKAVMSALGARDGRLVFTSCGSEASNLAIFGCAAAKARRTADRIITTDSEHPSVENPLRELEKRGFEIVRLPTRGGVPDETAVAAALEKPIFMVSMMLVNNETGALYDVGGVFAETRRRYPDAICHCDAVQGFLKVKFTPSALGADLITLSAHKIHGPKGVGALWISDRLIKSKKIVPVLLGGGQENGFRSGTENTIGIAGFAAAAQTGAKSFADDSERLHRLLDRVQAALSDTEIKINTPAHRAPHILSITLPNIKSETMLHFLSAKGIYVSSGSACSSNAKAHTPSRALTAFGLSAHDADCSLRISFSAQNTEADADALCLGLRQGLSSIVRAV